MYYPTPTKRGVHFSLAVGNLEGLLCLCQYCRGGKRTQFFSMETAGWSRGYCLKAFCLAWLCISLSFNRKCVGFCRALSYTSWGYQVLSSKLEEKKRKPRALTTRLLTGSEIFSQIPSSLHFLELSGVLYGKIRVLP